jgi:hypothetical protein
MKSISKARWISKSSDVKEEYSVFCRSINEAVLSSHQAECGKQAIKTEHMVAMKWLMKIWFIFRI